MFLLHFRLLGYEEWEDIVSVPRVDCQEAKIKPDKTKMGKDSKNDDLTSDEESSDSESESEGEVEEGKKQKKKDKVGFRDRKVNAIS
jgi:hypothetical protein